MDKYLSVGTNIISNDLFREIHNSVNKKSIKPSGGFWMTEFNPNLPAYNCWLDYIFERHIHLLFYKNKGVNPFKQPCSVVSLKKEAKIYNLSSADEYMYLLNNYGDDNNIINFEKLANNYDGIFVNLLSLNRCLKEEDSSLFSSFSVNTMLLFNVDCIDYYYAGTVDIENFDYTDMSDFVFVNYKIMWDNQKKYVENKNNCLVKKRIKE